MKVAINLFEFADIVGFWEGAEKVWDSLTNDQKDYINDYLEECNAEFDSLTQINDFVWFDVPEILAEETEDE